MAQTKLGILIETMYKGGGAKTAASDLGKLEKAASSASGKMFAARARTEKLSDAQNRLAARVKDGSLSAEKAGRIFDRYKSQLPIEETRQTTSATDKLKAGFGQMAVAAGTVAAAVYAAKKVFDFAQEGAQLQKVSDTFDSLTVSVGETSSAMLNDLRKATAGMVADTELMASANRFLSMGLANSSDEAAKLAEIAVTLGGAMGKEAGPAMEEFSLLLSNMSIPRLDTFGISASKVRTRITELQAETEGLSRETAFMTAVMEEAEISMDKLGNAVPVDEFTQLEVQIQNITDALKINAATAISPWINEVNTQVEQGQLLAETQERLKGDFDGTVDVLKEVAAVTMDANRQNNLLVEVNKLLESGVSGTAWQLVFMAEKTLVASERMEGMNKRGREYLAWLDPATDGTEELSDEIDLASTRGEKWQKTLDDANPALKRTTRELGRTKEAFEEAGEAADIAAERVAEAGARFDDSLSGGLKFFNRELDELGPRLVLTGGLTADQAAVTKQAEENAKRAGDAINDYATGLRGYGMEADEVADSVKSLAEEQAYWNAIAGQYSGIQATANLVTVEAKVDQKALNESFYESIRAQDILGDSERDNIQRKIDLGLQLGILNDTQADYIIQQWEMDEAARNLKAAFDDGTISAREASDMLAILGTDGAASMQIALDKAIELRVAIDDLPDEKRIRIITELSTVSTTRGASGGTTSTGETGEFEGGQDERGNTRAAGGPVSGGHSYLVGERGPEILYMPPGTSGTIIPNNQINTANNNQTVNIYTGADEAAIMRALDRAGIKANARRRAM